MSASGFLSPPAGPPSLENPGSDKQAFVARTLLRQADRAALATIHARLAHPYVSLVGIATDIDGSPILLLSRLAEHTRAILKNPQVSLLIDGTKGFTNPQQGPRLTLLGRVEPAPAERVARRFLSRHPGASLYAGFGDFAFYRMELERAHWIGGFGSAHWFVPAPACSPAAADEIEAGMVDFLARANDLPDAAFDRLAGRPRKGRAQGWRLVDADPDGIDLAAKNRKGKVSRRSFLEPVGNLAEIERALFGQAN
ncbi:pyridoxamine 5'-phosphate oxidase family protein [Telmatospirillum sp.]|uniref:HugZ family pyridoxamine 5'-phosphate oxidase n=1 Tax=Telmatospirillum sp. TaxID=2079197 RepID=UPI002842717F|nr:pyridoxamine 5'-phosphate oxidase family protein [Telmatospirillum sp.]MDR3440390.1 pyridoxamine 5'-phosphate oxidase family protein [Telmatospirillum sp.]